MAVREPNPIIIDGVRYPSYNAAAKAYGVTQQTISRRVNKLNTHSLTLADIRAGTGTDRGVPLRNVVKTPPVCTTLTWEFVYDRLTSSPKKRSVASHAVARLAA